MTGKLTFTVLVMLMTVSGFASTLSCKDDKNQTFNAKINKNSAIVVASSPLKFLTGKFKAWSRVYDNPTEGAHFMIIFELAKPGVAINVEFDDSSDIGVGQVIVGQKSISIVCKKTN